jgi:hypothetical protein
MPRAAIARKASRVSTTAGSSELTLSQFLRVELVQFQAPRPPIDLLRPFPADEMEAFEVSTDVGNVKNNSPELLNSK